MLQPVRTSLLVYFVKQVYRLNLRGNGVNIFEQFYYFVNFQACDSITEWILIIK